MEGKIVDSGEIGSVRCGLMRLGAGLGKGCLDQSGPIRTGAREELNQSAPGVTVWGKT